jgi:hypothetical protein
LEEGEFKQARPEREWTKESLTKPPFPDFSCKALSYSTMEASELHQVCVRTFRGVWIFTGESGILWACPPRFLQRSTTVFSLKEILFLSPDVRQPELTSGVKLTRSASHCCSLHSSEMFLHKEIK